MTLCQLIDKDIQQVSNEMRDFDVNNLDPNKYDDYIKALPANIELLKSFHSILNFQPETVQKLDELITSGIIDIKIINSKNIATRKKDITEDTIIYVGSLFSTTMTNKSAASLKYITGVLQLTSTQTTSIKMEYIGDLRVFSCPRLGSLFVKHLGAVVINNCCRLLSLQAQTIRGDCLIKDCQKLSIEGIQSFTVDKKIEIFGDVGTNQFTLDEVKSKFKLPTKN